MGYNSTIITKKRPLACGHFDYAFSRGRCKQCAKVEDFNNRQEKEHEAEGLSDYISQLDYWVSKYVRLKACDNSGVLKCYICDKPVKYSEAQAMHYIKRSCMYLRFDTGRNIKAGCNSCNCIKGGNYLEYAKKMEIESSGITEILYEEQRIIYKPTRDELISQISEYQNKINILKQKIKT